MIRMLIVAGGVLLMLGGLAVALSRPEVADPGPSIMLDTTPADAPTPLPSPGDARHVDGDRRAQAKNPRTNAGRHEVEKDDFLIAKPKAVKAHGDDWDDDSDDDWDDDRDDDDRDDDDREDD